MRLPAVTCAPPSTVRRVLSAPAPPPPVAAAPSRGFFNAFLPDGRSIRTFNVAAHLGPRTTGAKAVDPTYIQRNAAGAMVFVAPIRGETTKNAKYTRSELRETNADGTRLNWRIQDGPNGLDGDLSVNEVPPDRGAVVFAQIHTHRETKPALKLNFERRPAPEGGRIYAEFRDRPGMDPRRINLMLGVKLGQRFSYSMTVAPNGRLTITISSGGVTRIHQLAMDADWNTKALYFKAGAYNKTFRGRDTDRSVVVYHRIASRRPVVRPPASRPQGARAP